MKVFNAIFLLVSIGGTLFFPIVIVNALVGFVPTNWIFVAFMVVCSGNLAWFGYSGSTIFEQVFIYIRGEKHLHSEVDLIDGCEQLITHAEFCEISEITNRLLEYARDPEQYIITLGRSLSFIDANFMSRELGYRIFNLPLNDFRHSPFHEERIFDTGKLDDKMEESLFQYFDRVLKQLIDLNPRGVMLA
jgi:hypothetical protein